MKPEQLIAVLNIINAEGQQLKGTTVCELFDRASIPEADRADLYKQIGIGRGWIRSTGLNGVISVVRTGGFKWPDSIVKGHTEKFGKFTYVLLEPFKTVKDNHWIYCTECRLIRKVRLNSVRRQQFCMCSNKFQPLNAAETLTKAQRQGLRSTIKPVHLVDGEWVEMHEEKLKDKDKDQHWLCEVCCMPPEFVSGALNVLKKGHECCACSESYFADSWEALLWHLKYHGKDTSCYSRLIKGQKWRGTHAKYKFYCPKHRLLDPQVLNNVLDGTGCPSCAQTGYNPDKTGYLYVLRTFIFFESDWMPIYKLGISNYKIRLPDLTTGRMTFLKSEENRYKSEEAYEGGWQIVYQSRATDGHVIAAREQEYKKEHKAELLTDIWPDAPKFFKTTKHSEIYFVRPHYVRMELNDQPQASQAHWSVGKTVEAEIQPLMDWCEAAEPSLDLY